VKEWCENYHIKSPGTINFDRSSPVNFEFHPEYPPLESGVTQLVHGEVKLIPSPVAGNLEKCLSALNEVMVPFIQVSVPVNQNTLELQRNLKEKGFQAFIFTPGYGDQQPPELWFGKCNGVSVVPRYWDVEKDKNNPFWNQKLENHGKRIAGNW
jgi:hypothetical protein